MEMTIDKHTCDTCEYGEWYRHGYDITMMDDECGGCCSWNDKWKPKRSIEDGNGEFDDSMSDWQGEDRWNQTS